MGVDYDAVLVLGCVATDDDFSVFEKKSSKKAKKAADFTDEELEELYVFEGKEYSRDNIDDLANAIAKKVDCSMSSYGDYVSGELFTYIFSAKKSCIRNGEAPMAVPAAEQKELARIHKELKKLGMKSILKPGFSAVLSVG